jgi:glycosyltransferase involved in cell wall biosynthesis
MGSTYTVSHNLSAIEILLKEIAPNIFKTNPNDFVFHILGNKFPKKLDSFVRDNVVCDGYVADLDSFLSTMDIAIVPSLFGAGMQQKIFESLSRGFPTITTKRGMGDYPFKEGEQVLFADNVEKFCSGLISLKDPEVRVKLSKEAKKLSKTLFSQEVLDKTVLEAISIQKEL